MSNLDRVKAFHARQKALNRCRRDYWATPDEHAKIKELLKELRGEQI